MSLLPSAPPGRSPSRSSCPEQTTGRWFAREVHPHDGKLKSYLRNSFPSVHDIDDVVQESYLRIWKAREAQPILSAKAFLFKVARHVALDLMRKRSRSPLEPTEWTDTSGVADWQPNGVEALASSDALNHLAAALATLPTRCREVVVMHKLNGISQQAVANRLGVSERTVEKHCARALKHCQRYLGERGIHGFFRR